MNQKLKGLDTLRAFAAIIVVIGHIELVKSSKKIDDFFDTVPSGHIAVVLFFVISGFLITFLLAKEFDLNNKISFKKFYIRRILRIWPLYYFVVFLSIIIYNYNPSIKSYLLCLTIFPNVAHVFGEGWTASPQIWSIGVEEQFYLLWPCVFSFIIIKKKKFISFILLFIFLTLSFIPHFIAYFNSRYFDYEFLTALEKLFNFSNYNCIGFGCFIGIAYWRNSKWINFFNSNLITLPLLITVSFMWLFNFRYSYFTNEIFAILFSFVVLGLVGNKTINIDNVFFSFLGKISYGIYMYHWVIIEIVINLLDKRTNLFLYNFALYSMVIGSTIIVSFISYNFFEKKFIDLKKNYNFQKKIAN